MRLHDVERGDGPLWSLLIRGISLLSGMRLPDAARVAFYHRSFFGDSMGAWTQATMRGTSAWSVGERELLAAMTANWNACSFCIGAHGAIAARVLGRPLVQATLANYRQAELPANVQAILPLLEIVTQRPDEVQAEDVQMVLRSGVTSEALEDALAVCAIFNITTRCADTLGYQMLDDTAFDQAAPQLLARGYAFGKGKTLAHPDHRALAEAVRRHVLEGPGVTEAAVRQAMAARAAGESPREAPDNDLAYQIGKAAYQISDEQVAQLVKQTGSERAAFELIVAAAVGAGLHRWQRGLAALTMIVQAV